MSAEVSRILIWTLTDNKCQSKMKPSNDIIHNSDVNFNFIAWLIFQYRLTHFQDMSKISGNADGLPLTHLHAYRTTIYGVDRDHDEIKKL